MFFNFENFQYFSIELTHSMFLLKYANTLDLLISDYNYCLDLTLLDLLHSYSTHVPDFCHGCHAKFLLSRVMRNVASKR